MEFGGEVVANLLTGVDDNAQLENVFEGPDLVIDFDIGADFTVQLWETSTETNQLWAWTAANVNTALPVLAIGGVCWELGWCS